MSEENKTEGIEEVRAAYDRKSAEYDGIVAEFKQYKAGVVFEAQGFNAKQADLFLAQYPDAEVNPETVATFAAEFGLAATEVSEAAELSKQEAQGHLPTDGSPPPVERTLIDGPKPADGALASLQGAAGTPAATIGSALPTKMSQSEFQALLVSNPDEAAKAYSEGRAPMNDANVQADQLRSKGIIR